jgi:Protein of Unknown function (DUF2784)
MVWARVLADLIVVFHAAYVAFVVFGFAAILLGAALRWSWVRNRWFRSLHLAAIGIVVAESAIGMKCPLTVWERELRQAAGQASYTGDFIGYWVHRLIFIRTEPWLYSVTYLLFGMAVLAASWLAPPKWK